VHEERFFELAGELVVEVELAVTDDEARRLLARIREEGIDLFYVLTPVEFGFIS